MTRAEMATFLARALKLVELPGAPQAGSYRLYYEHFGGDWPMWTTTLQGVNRKLDSTSSGGIFSPDGALVAYSKWGPRVYVLNLNSGAVREIAEHPTGGGSVQYMTWSPDGKLLTYVVRAPYPSNDTEVWIVEANGQNWRKLSNVIRLPSFSPDSRFILYPVGDADANYSHSVIENLRTGSQIKVFSSSSVDQGFTPDSQRVFYRANIRPRSEYTSASMWDYMTINTDGTDRRTLASGATHRLFWSPDGTKVVYRGSSTYEASISEDDGETWRDATLAKVGPYRVSDASGTVLGEFPREGSGCEKVIWLPDGLIFLHFKQGDMVVDTNNFTYSFEEDDEGVTFLSQRVFGLSPDRQRIAYTIAYPVGGPYMGYQLWMMDADGSNSRKLVDHITGYLWSTDGHYIAYAIVHCTDPPTCHRSGGNELWIAERDGSSPRKVASTDGRVQFTNLRWVSS